MAFPQTAAPTETSLTTSGTSHPVTMPATVDAGDLLVVFVGFLATAAQAVITTPSGWTQKWHASASSTRHNTNACYIKVADGTEDGATVDFVTDIAATGAAQCYRVTAWFGALAGAEAGTATTQTGTAPNPPSLTASWGSADNLWFAAQGNTDDAGTVTAYPTNYLSGVNTVIGGANTGYGVGTARRELAAATDDPGAFTLSESETSVADTLVIRPAAAGTTTPKTIAVAATGAAAQGEAVISARAVAAAATGAAAQAEVPIFGRAVSAAATATIGVVKAISKTIAAAATGAAAAARAVAKTIAASATGTAAQGRALVFAAAVAAAASGAASLAAVFIAGSGAARRLIRALLRPIRRPIRRPLRNPPPGGA